MTLTRGLPCHPKIVANLTLSMLEEWVISVEFSGAAG